MIRAAWTVLGLVACAMLVTGCGGGKADETKPIADVKAEAEKMDASQLRATALAYKTALDAKKVEADKVGADLKAVPLTEALGDKAKDLKARVEKLQSSVSALKERYSIYVEELKKKKGDVSGLEG